MNRYLRSLTPLAAALGLSFATSNALAYDSGSTGADGALNPTVSTQVQLPANGVLNYTTINIPVGVTVTFAKNTTNTPVVLLVGGDAIIAGTLHVNGNPAAATGGAGDGNIGDDGTPGTAGPGGFDGGQGGRGAVALALRESQAGLGPGGAGRSAMNGDLSCGGSGGGFGAVGGFGGRQSTNFCLGPGFTSQGLAYGQPSLLPLVGGSGGGGGAGGSVFIGAGGGGGGGALAIAVSGTLSLTGAIRANGGAGGLVASAGSGGAGGGGSGGGIRLIATTLSGNGALTAAGGFAQQTGTGFNPSEAGEGAVGRIRIEAETYTRTAASTPPHTIGAPGATFVAGLPTLRIARVGGTAAPAEPTGNADISLPEGTTNPVAVEVSTTGVPLGNTVTVVVRSQYGAPTSHVSTALAGTVASATANANVTLPTGPSTLLAQVSYSVPAAMAMQSPLRELSGDDDLIERIAIESATDGTTRRTAITRLGRRIELPDLLAAGA